MGTDREAEYRNAAMAEKCPERKRKIRMEALKRRDHLTAGQRRDYSGRIVKKLIGLPCYQEADAVLTYISFRSEVDTFPLLERAFADGKAVFAPKVTGRDMEFYKISEVEELTAGYQGIREPKGGTVFLDWLSQNSEKPNVEDAVWTGENDKEPATARILICMPGAAFDRARHRIGYGGGFYDRYLCRLLRVLRENENKDAEAASQPRAGAVFTTVAFAYNCQIFEEIPWETHDICPERIVTETEIF